MVIAGLTGNIGSGKSTVARIMESMDVPVFKADAIGRKAYDDPEVMSQVISVLGKGILDESGRPDRQRIASLVFTDEHLLEKLNGIIHPWVRSRFLEWMAGLNASFCVYEAAIIFESGYYKRLSATICVLAPLEVRMARVMKRDGSSEEAFIVRESRQLDQERKKELADLVINNDGIEPLLPQVVAVVEALHGLAGRLGS